MRIQPFIKVLAIINYYSQIQIHSYHPPPSYVLDNGYMKPHHWVDDNPLRQGNNGSLDPSTFQHVT